MIDLRVLVVPGTLVAASAAFNLLRYRNWHRTDAVLLERKIIPAENMPDYLMVEYVVDGAPFEASPDMIGKLEAGSKVGDLISILYDPLNPRRCVLYSPRNGAAKCLIGLMLIFLSQIEIGKLGLR